MSKTRSIPYEDHSNFRKHLHLIYLEQSPGHCTMACEITEEFLNNGGIAHGGVLLTLADHCIGTCFAGRPDGASYVTTDLHYRFLGPAEKGDLVICKGEVVRAGGHLLIGSCTLSVQDRLIGTANAQYYVLDSDQKKEG